MNLFHTFLLPAGAALGASLLALGLRGDGAALLGGGAVLLLAAALAQAMQLRALRTALRRLRRWCESDEATAPPPLPEPLRQVAADCFARFSRIEERAAARNVEARRAKVEVRSLRQQHDLLLSLLESLADGVILFDSTGTPRLLNRAARSFLELAPDEPVAGAAASARSPALRAALGDALRGADGRAARDVDCSDQTQRRVLRMSCLTVRPLGDDPADEQPSLAVVLRDVTRERELNRMKSDFASSVSHELKTPLSSMRAFLEMLLDGDIDGEDERREHLQMILDETERLSRLVQNLLNLSRLESGVTRMDCEPVPLTELLEHLRQVVTPLANARRQSILFELSDYLPSVTGDKNLLEQAVMNLVSNAIKYTPEGGAVRVRAGISGSEVEIVVADTGVGIPEKALDLIFEKFTRIENHAGLKATGTGLGLPLAKFVAEAHGGRITVRSEVGKGSEFRVFLPMRKGTDGSESRLVGLEGVTQ